MAKSIRRSALLGFVVSLLIAPGAAATVTIGSNLGRAPNFAASCSCTNMQTSLPSASQAPDGLTSPVNGTVTFWSVRSGPSSTDSVAFRVIRPLAGGLFLGAAASAPQTPAANSTMTYPVSIPIARFDRIGLNWGSSIGNHLVSAGGTDGRWAPFLADGESSAPDFADTREVAVNAIVEPTAAFALDEVKSNKGSVTAITVTVQNIGKLTAGDPSSPKKKPRLFNNGAFRIGGPGQISLSIRASKTARKLIREKGKAIKAQLKIAFVPTGGTAAAQTVRVKLKP